MAGSITGGKQAAVTNRIRHGEDYYPRIGAEGGKKKNPYKGFGADRARAENAGKKGGSVSRRGYTLVKRGRLFNTYISKKTGKTKRIRVNG